MATLYLSQSRARAKRRRATVGHILLVAALVLGAAVLIVSDPAFPSSGEFGGHPYGEAQLTAIPQQ